MGENTNITFENLLYHSGYANKLQLFLTHLL